MGSSITCMTLHNVPRASSSPPQLADMAAPSCEHHRGHSPLTVIAYPTQPGFAVDELHPTPASPEGNNYCASKVTLYTLHIRTHTSTHLRRIGVV